MARRKSTRKPKPGAPKRKAASARRSKPARPVASGRPVDRHDVRERLGLLRQFIHPGRLARAAGVSERTAKQWLARGTAPEKYVSAIRKLSGNVAGQHRRLHRERYGIDIPANAMVPTFQGTRYNTKTRERGPWQTLEFDVSGASPERYRALIHSLIDQGFAVRTLYHVSNAHLQSEDEDEDGLIAHAAHYGELNVSTKWAIDMREADPTRFRHGIKPMWVIANPGLGLGSDFSGFKHHE
jgi:hypothetical protein